jgi:hypothetical protein
MSMAFTREQIEKAVKTKGYAWFDSQKDFDVNIVGIRNSATGNRVTNRFDDWLTVSYKITGQWQFHIWQATTDPGITHTQQKLLNPKGVARLVPGQYRGSHQIGLHQGKYSALVQRTPLPVWRDANCNSTFEETVVDTGMFGINIHRSSPNGTSTLVDGWSAGCQVFANINAFSKFMRIMEQSREVFGNKFTYTLITSNDIG